MYSPFSIMFAMKEAMENDDVLILFLEAVYVMNTDGCAFPYVLITQGECKDFSLLG